MEGLRLGLTILVCGLVTFALRLSFILFGGRMTPSARFSRFLHYVPPAVLASLIAPEVLIRGGVVDFSWRNPRLWAAVIAVGIAWWTRSVIATISLGLLALWGAGFLLAF